MGKRHPRDCNCYDCVQKWAMRRYEAQRSGSKERPINREVYGSRGYSNESYSRTGRTFDGYPSLSKRRSDGKIDIIYGPEPLSLNDEMHGHAVIKNGKLIYKRRPGEADPIIDLGG